MTDASKRTAANDPAMKDTNLKTAYAYQNLVFNSYVTLIPSPHYDSKLFIRELSDVHAGGRVRFVQPSTEKMGKFVELAELP